MEQNQDGFLLERFLLFDHLWFAAHLMGRAQRFEIWLESLTVRGQFLSRSLLSLRHDPWALLPSRCSPQVRHKQKMQLKGEHDALLPLWRSFHFSAGLWLLMGATHLPIPRNCHWLRSHRGQGGRGVRPHPRDESIFGEGLRL